jgi:hypothetical protein
MRIGSFSPLKTQQVSSPQPQPPRSSPVDGFLAPKPAGKVDLSGAPQKQFPPVPAEWRDGKKYKLAPKDLEGLIERGIAQGGFELAVAWLQEAHGLKVDGKFGKGTFDALCDNATLLQQLREQRLAETPGAMSKPLKPLSPQVKEKLKADLTDVRDRAPDFERGYQAAVTKLQEVLVRSGEPMVIDGKLGKDTYNSMVRLYGRATADELSRHLQMLKSGDGDM